MLKKLLFIITVVCQSNISMGRDVFITMQDTLFVKTPVPDRGIVCSNIERTLRLKDNLKNIKHFKTSWGTNLFIGTYKNIPMFIVNAPVGSGSGLVFTELYTAGAKYIVRFGSDDVRNPSPEEYNMVKLIDETDNLYGFNEASGVDPSEYGKSVAASPTLVNVFEKIARENNMEVEKRVCHHLEHYHSLRYPDKFSPARADRLKQRLEALKRTDKKESFDMESAVLFRVAKDFDGHAISILQTVDKESQTGPYASVNREKALQEEKRIFFYVADTLTHL